MKWMLLSIFLVSCYTASSELNLEGINIPKEYVAVQSFRDSGFAGQNAQFWENNFSVKQEVAQDNMLTMSGIVDEAKQITFQDSLFVDSFTTCHLYAKPPTLSVILCVRDSEILFYERQETLGNHQTRTLTWELQDEEFQLYDCGRTTYCKIFEKAKSYNSNTCNNLEFFKPMCDEN